MPHQSPPGTHYADDVVKWPTAGPTKQKFRWFSWLSSDFEDFYFFFVFYDDIIFHGDPYTLKR